MSERRFPNMAEIFHNKRPETAVEGREERESFEKNRAFAGAVLKWMDALTKLPVIEDLPLPRSKKLGAAFVPTVLFTALIGCAHELKIVDCGDDERTYIKATAQWIDEHPDEIQQSLDEFWPNANITVDQLTDTLVNAQIMCGVENENRSNDIDVAGTARLEKNLIVVDINEVQFEAGLEQYCSGSWTANESMDLLAKEIQYVDYDEAEQIYLDVRNYYSAIASLSSVLAHEVAHLALDQKHSDEVKAYVRSDAYYNADEEQIRMLDEMFAWGYAADYAVRTVRDIEIEPVSDSFSDRFIEESNN